MKTYKTWEVIKMLSENPTLKFADEFGRVIENYTGEIKVTFNNEQSILNIDEKWTLKQEPVSFMEAVEAYKNKRNIYCIVDGCRYYYVPIDLDDYYGLIDTTDTAVSAKEILEGKWYIEE